MDRIFDVLQVEMDRELGQLQFKHFINEIKSIVFVYNSYLPKKGVTERHPKMCAERNWVGLVESESSRENLKHCFASVHNRLRNERFGDIFYKT